jgi:hypothetical protein
MSRNKRRKRQAPEYLYRDVSISEARAWVSMGGQQEKDQEPQFHSIIAVELKGVLDEPIRGVQAIELSLHPRDDATPGKGPFPWIGLIHGIKPVIRGFVFIPHREFDWVWTLAVSGFLKHAQMHLTPPRFNKAHIFHLTLSTHPEESDD